MSNEKISALKELLQELYLQQEDTLKTRYQRSLPLQDGLIDRWERAKRLGFDKDASIYNSAYVFDKVSVGKNTWIGPCAILDGSGGELIIGDYCSISAGVHIYTHDTVAWALSGGKLPAHHKAVTIGNCCHIGAQSTITAGVTIGNHCVIGANSFVNKSYGDYLIIAGSPAKIIGEIEILDEKINFIYH